MSSCLVNNIYFLPNFNGSLIKDIAYVINVCDMIIRIHFLHRHTLLSLLAHFGNSNFVILSVKCKIANSLALQSHEICMHCSSYLRLCVISSQAMPVTGLVITFHYHACTRHIVHGDQ